jgi:hypothetical protein
MIICVIPIAIGSNGEDTSPMSNRTYTLTADQLGVGDQFYAGRTLRTVTRVTTRELLTELTTTTYIETKHDYVAKTQFVERTKTYRVLV